MNLLDLVIVAAAALYGFTGFRNGAVIGAMSLAGFFLGAAVGAQLAEPLGTRLADGRAQVPVAIICVLFLAMLGQLGGVWVAGHIKSRLIRAGAGRWVDASIGLVLGIVAVLLVSWMIAVPLASSPYPSLAAQASHSEIVRGVNDVMPNGMRSLYSKLRDFLDRSGFPPVFGDLPSTSITSVAAPDPQLSPAVREQVRRAGRSTVKIYATSPECGRRTEGSGFVIANGYVLTNAHVVAGARQVVVLAPQQGTLSAAVVRYDPERDVAVLRVPGLTSAALRFAAKPAATGDPAVVLGYPEDGPFTVRSARVRARATVSGADIYGNGTVEREVYSVRAVVRSGNSGGPLLSDEGTVLGVVFATALDSADTGYVLTAAEVGSDATLGQRSTRPVATGACTSG